MIDYKPTLKSNLETLGLPVYYELFVNGSTPTPCITYIEAGNYADLEGDTLLYRGSRELLTMSYLMEQNN